MSASHRFTDHTAEVELTLQADTLPELYAEAARALAELLLGSPPPPADAPPLKVTVRSPDLTALLIDWLNELIYRTETEATVFTEAAVLRVDEQEISAELRGLYAPELATEVKAATLHDAYVRPTARGFVGHAILDV
jgi:SHS2 domain-containing protein